MDREAPLRGSSVDGATGTLIQLPEMCIEDEVQHEDLACTGACPCGSGRGRSPCPSGGRAHEALRDDIVEGGGGLRPGSGWHRRRPMQEDPDVDLNERLLHRPRSRRTGDNTSPSGAPVRGGGGRGGGGFPQAELPTEPGRGPRHSSPAHETTHFFFPRAPRQSEAADWDRTEPAPERWQRPIGAAVSRLGGFSTGGRLRTRTG